MHSFRVYSVEFKYENGNNLNLAPGTDDFNNVKNSFALEKNKTILLNEDTEFDPSSNGEDYILRNLNKDTISIESLKYSEDYHLLQITCGIGNFGKFNSARDLDGNITDLKNKSAEAERFATFLFPPESATEALLIVETQGHLDPRKRLINLLEQNSERALGEKIELIAAQLVDPEYVMKFISESKNVEISFRGKPADSDPSAPARKIDFRFSFDRIKSAWIINQIIRFIPKWSKDEESGISAFNDMKSILFEPIDYAETPLDTFTGLEEVRFKFNQKYFSVDELLGKAFSYPLDSSHPTEKSWLSNISETIFSLAKENNLVLNKYNIDKLMKNFVEVGEVSHSMEDVEALDIGA